MKIIDLRVILVEMHGRFTPATAVRVAAIVETGAADIMQVDVDVTHFDGLLPMKHVAGRADAHDQLLSGGV